jgi:hypothetical protein
MVALPSQVFFDGDWYKLSYRNEDGSWTEYKSSTDSFAGNVKFLTSIFWSS